MQTAMGWVRSRISLGDERGFSLVEVMAALTIMSFGFLALAGTASTGARMLAEGRQRQAATEIASREIEHMRNIPYEEVALASGITPSSDETDPNYWVSSDGLAYDHDQDGTYEALVIKAGGLIPHNEDLEVGPTQLRIFRYVTWVDDPNIAGTQNYKRITVVAFYRAPVNTGRAREVRASALFTAGSVTVGGTAASGTVGSTASPTPTPSPTPTGSCSGDTSPPSSSANYFSILSGTGAAQGYTSSQSVTISMTASDPCLPITVRFSNDNTTFGDPITYDPNNPTATWVVTPGDGTKNVYARFSDGIGNTTGSIGPRTIILDQTKPTVPGTLSRTMSCSGNNRTVNLSWGSSSDANLLGYRVYRSIDSGPFEVIATTSNLTRSDTHSKLLDSVRYRVVAYDRAGNESDPTNEISLAKNQCS